MFGCDSYDSCDIIFCTYPPLSFPLVSNVLIPEWSLSQQLLLSSSSVRLTCPFSCLITRLAAGHLCLGFLNELPSYELCSDTLIAFDWFVWGEYWLCWLLMLTVCYEWCSPDVSCFVLLVMTWWMCCKPSPLLLLPSCHFPSLLYLSCVCLAGYSMAASHYHCSCCSTFSLAVLYQDAPPPSRDTQTDISSTLKSTSLLISVRLVYWYSRRTPAEGSGSKE